MEFFTAHHRFDNLEMLQGTCDKNRWKDLEALDGKPFIHAL